MLEPSTEDNCRRVKHKKFGLIGSKKINVAVSVEGKLKPKSQQTKNRLKDDIFRRCEILKENYNAEIIVFMHFPNSKETTTYCNAYGDVALKHFLTLDDYAEKFYENCCNRSEDTTDSCSRPEKKNLLCKDTTGLPDQCNNITDTSSIESPQISLLQNSSELFTCHSPINSLLVPQSNASNRATVGLSKGSSGKDTSEFPDQCTTITDAVSTDSPTNFAHPIGTTRRTKAQKGVPEKRARSEGKQHASSRVKNSVIDLDYHKSITGDVLTRSLIPDCAGQLKIGSRNSCENFSSATPSPTPPFPPTPTPSPTPSFPPTPSPSPIHPVPLPLQISNAIKVNNKDLVETPEGMFFRGPQGKLLKVVRCTQDP